jgi:uncharacterized protein with PQ loop repeat
MKALNSKYRSRLSREFDIATYMFGVLMPIFTLPQAYTAVVLQEVEGLSLVTWSFYLVSAVVFAIFGIIHKEKLLMLTYIPLALVEIAVVAAIFSYA